MAQFRRRIVASSCFLAALALSTPARAGDHYGDPGAVDAFHDATANTDLRSAGSPAFELLAVINLDVKGQSLNGTYQLLWESGDHWREEIILPGYQRIKVQGQNGVWLHRSLNYEVPSVKELDDALDFTGKLLRNVRLKPGKLKAKIISGEELECSHIEFSEALTDEDFCFDARQSVLKAVLTPSGVVSMPDVTSIEYSDFAPFGIRVYPHTVRILGGSNALLTFSVQRLAPLVRPKESDFAAPTNALFMATCSSPQQPQPIGRIAPVYPQGLRGPHRPVRLVIYVLVASDGSIQSAAVAFTSSPDFDDAALTAVRQLHYKPKRCNGTPTPFETYVTFNFF